ncbi:MAG: hypothetical protein H0U10_00075 [Chloroflexia bacterium]|nr:hypothetical protein [Chloroflexia bacterium]
MSTPVKLNDEDVTYLLTLLRNASQPITTQQLIDALRRQSGPPEPSAPPMANDS